MLLLSRKYSKTCLKRPLKKKPNFGFLFEWPLKTGFKDRLSLNAGQKYCRMLQEGGGHSSILLICIKR